MQESAPNPSALSATLAGRRVLVISHDFPPVRSPQALRTWHFVHAIAAEAVAVDLLCRAPPPGLKVDAVPANVIVHAASPGPFENLIDHLKAWRRYDQPQERHEGATGAPVSLNWKGRVVKALRALLDLVLYPDSRVFWTKSARVSLRKLLATSRPDVALVMHEPAASLLLAEQLDVAGVPWLADLADPVMAPYTPRHWRRRALRLEAQTIRSAARIAVTNAATAELLAERHGRPDSEPLILSQGHGTPVDLPTELPSACREEADTTLRLCYTGRLYDFRRIDHVISAVLATEGIRLIVAGPECPAILTDAARQAPHKFELHGELSHGAALALQRNADVLLSIGNAGTVQSPGKLFEYFGAARPVLHVASNRLDSQIGLVASLRRGRSCENDSSDIERCLTEFRDLKAASRLDAAFDLSEATVARFGWPAIGRTLCAALASLLPAPDRTGVT